MIDDLPDQACHAGYTEEQVKLFFGLVGLPGFLSWVDNHGQGIVFCDGTYCNPDTKQSYPVCSSPHGKIYKVHDVLKFIYLAS